MNADDNMRYTYRLRISNTAQRALLDDWDRCRWVWNECVAASHRACRAGGRVGPAVLDRMLTRARVSTSWLRQGASVPQQQIIRDFGRSQAKALKDRVERVPQHRRAGMPQFKKKHEAAPSLNYTRGGFSLRDGRLRLAGGVEVWSRDLPAVPSSVRVYRDTLGHWYCSFVVPAQSEPSADTGRAIGVDWGVTETATTSSDGYDLPHAQHGKSTRRGIARSAGQEPRTACRCRNVLHLRIVRNLNPEG